MSVVKKEKYISHLVSKGVLRKVGYDRVTDGIPTCVLGGESIYYPYSMRIKINKPSNGLHIK